VARGQKTSNRDFASAKGLLSEESTPNEITWSGGSRLDAATVAKAFKLEARQDLLRRADVAPAGSFRALGWGTILVIVVLLIVLVLLLSRCSRCDPAVENCNSSGYRSSGGSYGGYSGGGGSHK